jgi:hypothetical protein
MLAAQWKQHHNLQQHFLKQPELQPWLGEVPKVLKPVGTAVVV